MPRFPHVGFASHRVNKSDLKTFGLDALYFDQSKLRAKLRPVPEAEVNLNREILTIDKRETRPKTAIGARYRSRVL